MRRALILIAVIVTGGACDRAPSPRQLELDAITVGAAHLRTDTIGDARYSELATFVLVDADNASEDGAFVTLTGELTDGSQTLGTLKPQSLWIPARSSRMFALVDDARAARPTANAARIVVRGASIDTPPVAHVDAVKQLDDYGKTVVQGELVNDADRPGTAMVIASFHDAKGKPMTRPFEMIAMAPGSHQHVQFVGPQGSTTGAIYVGDIVY